MTNPMKTLALLIPLLLTSCDGSAFASFARDELYRSGQKAIDEGRWSEAVSIFTQVAERGGPEADAGLYWKAYAQDRLGQRAEARDEIIDECEEPVVEFLDLRFVLVVDRPECGALGTGHVEVARVDVVQAAHVRVAALLQGAPVMPLAANAEPVVRGGVECPARRTPPLTPALR